SSFEQTPGKLNRGQGVSVQIGSGGTPIASGGGSSPGPDPEPEPEEPQETPLSKVNSAATATAVKAALTDEALGLQLEAYEALAAFQQDAAAKMVYYAKGNGFADEEEVQAALDAAVVKQFTISNDFSSEDAADDFTTIYGYWSITEDG